MRWWGWTLGLVSSCLIACADEAPPFDANCAGCRHDGESCAYSINCGSGSLCNDAHEDLFEPKAPVSTCVRVICARDEECAAPKVCTVAGVCRAPTCETNAECPSPLACVGGACAAKPSAGTAARCTVVTPPSPLASGDRVPLEALAFDDRGAVIPWASFTWSSSDDAVLGVTGSVALAGRAGTAMISAHLVERSEVTCSGGAIPVFEPPGPDRVRVVVIDERTGAPLPDARVVIVAGRTQTSTTGALGQIELATTSTIVESVTVVKAGYRITTVLAPRTRDVLLAAAPLDDLTKSAGIRGAVDLSSTRRADFQLAVVYGARAPELLDYRPVPGADVAPAVIEAPELGVERSERELPGNVLLGMGVRHFTERPERCFDAHLGADRLGCFLVRTRPGRTAAWVMGANVPLSRITSLANELVDLTFSPEVAGRWLTSDRARLTLLLSPFAMDLWIGAAPLLDIEVSDRVPRLGASASACKSPTTTFESCLSDYPRYLPVDLALTAPAMPQSYVKLPRLPELPVSGCAGGVIASDYAVLTGRGLVLVGLGLAEDATRDRAPDCVVDGVARPFGFASRSSKDGELALRTSALAGGLEGSRRVLVFAAVDTGAGEERPRDLNLLVEHAERRDPSFDLSSRRFLAHPRGRLDRAALRFVFESSADDVHLAGRRLSFETLEGAWVIHAPPEVRDVVLPDVAEGRHILAAAQTGVVQSFQLDAPYEELFALAGRARVDRTIDHLRAVATTQCTPGSGACAME